MLDGGLGRNGGGGGCWLGRAKGATLLRTGGGGGVPLGRDSGALGMPLGRGGSDTGRGGCATGLGATADGARQKRVQAVVQQFFQVEKMQVAERPAQ